MNSVIQHQKLTRLYDLKIKQEQIKQEEEGLINPLLTNTENIGKIYFHFNSIISSLPERSKPDPRATKKIFIFIILYLYSPKALCGHYLSRGMRDILTDVMELRSKHSVSHYSEGLMLWYLSYPKFQQCVDLVFNQLIQVIHSFKEK